MPAPIKVTANNSPVTNVAVNGDLAAKIATKPQAAKSPLAAGEM